VQIPTGGTARKPFVRVARFGETPKPTVKKVLSFAVWMRKGASMKGNTDMMLSVRSWDDLCAAGGGFFRRLFVLSEVFCAPSRTPRYTIGRALVRL